MIQTSFRLEAEGLAKVLGDLEAKIMRVLWDLDEAVPARTVYERIMDSHDVSSLTVITVLNKLVSKKLLRRFRRADLFHYEPVMEESDFIARASRSVMEGVLAFEPDAVAASFVDILAEHDRERLTELAKIIRRKLKDTTAPGGKTSGGKKA